MAKATAKKTAKKATAYPPIRKSDWTKWAETYGKVINDQAARYEGPFGKGKRTIDLPEFVRWFHRFLASNARRLSGRQTGDPDLASEKIRAELRVKTAHAIRLERENLRESERWVSREEVHTGLALLIPELRKAAETLQRRFGSAAHDVLDEAIGNAIQLVESRFGNGDHHNGNGSAE